jgi:Fe-S-cluster containining protein
MDDVYAQTAEHFGFECRGCRDNCCETEFHHHTLAEYLYLRNGLSQLPEAVQDEIRRRAHRVRQQMSSARDQGLKPRIMCPLNHGQRCLLYPHRPMICRLHGVPHQLKRPDGKIQIGPGCAEFHHGSGMPREVLLDRTPLYQALSQLEQQLRQAAGFHRKIKLTVAEILTVEL